MSSLYNLEPQPTAKVLLTTTSGDLLLELFAKQTPLASRNFLQLCLDGYYNDTIFHRLVPGFIIQGGDPTATGHGGEAIYPGGVFEDEFHSRLKFSRRGLLGMANSGGGGKGDNGSQFFLTLGECRELEGRNTLFGRIVGDTIYNLMKMGEAELSGVEGDERPLYPTKVTGAEILVNPFEDMVKREPKPKVQVGMMEKQEGKKKVKKKGGKGLLSFGGEDGEEEDVPVLTKQKFNPKLVSAGNGTPAATEANKDFKASGKFAEKTRRRRSSTSMSPPQRTKPNPELQLPLPKDEEPSRPPSSSPEPAAVTKVSTLLDQTNAQIADLKASMKRNIQAAPATETKKKSALEQMIPETSTRGRKRKLGANGDAPVDKQTLDMLDAFRAKLAQAPPEIESSRSPAPDDQVKQDQANGNENRNEKVDDDNGEEVALCDLHFIANCQSCQSWDQHLSGDTDAQNDDSRGWMSHALSFEKDRLGKDLTWKKKNEEELVVIDPREKAKDIREEQRAKKMAKTGGRTWDRDRERGRLPDRKAG